jgi:S-DNA-T family DNA segregation ATPase FtsK/SpoIIIE
VSASGRSTRLRASSKKKKTAAKKAFVAYKSAKFPPEVPALISAIISVAIILSLISHRWGDLRAGEGGELNNHLGMTGAYISAGLIKVFGLVSFWPAPVFFLISLFCFISRPGRLTYRQMAAGLILAVSAALALAALVWPSVTVSFLWPGEKIIGGGVVGAFLASGLISAIGRVGSYAVLPVLAISGLILAFGLSPVSVGRKIARWVLSRLKASSDNKAGESLKPKDPEQLEDFEPEAESPPTNTLSEPVLADPLPASPVIVEKTRPPALERKAKPKVHGGEGRYELPSIDLLDEVADRSHGYSSGLSREQLTANARLLEAKLLEFGVEGRVTEVSGGPVITMYEYQPAPGVKIAKVAALANDLTMAMKATAIRVVAPIPGKDAIGLEIPNPKRTVVSFREVIESQAFRSSSSPLTLVLGVDLTGVPVVTDLAKMPHLLIAGATGSGKSVGLDCMIMGILYRADPQTVKFLMIDPKCVEMALYQDLPHLLYPVLTEVDEATVALKWAVHEMDQRYRQMAEKGVRNIQGYNDRIQAELEQYRANSETEPPSPMPYLVIIIDELSDLMLQAAKEVEVAINRLAAKARAAGIHLILATQRPSVDVLTGVIKANLPTRLSFQVATKVDSKTILDRMGAEQLLGKGDMLFMPPGSAKLHRLHGAYVSDEEKKKVTDYIRSFGPPEYLETLSLPERGEETSGQSRDEKYQESVELVRRLGKASVSILQRYLNIGYNRAARIMEDLEREGVVGPQVGSKARDVYY